MSKFIINRNRKSKIDLHEIYFWTATIKDWNTLLKTDQFKDIIIESLFYLSEKKKIEVFGFVIMPNHMHLIWKMLSMNGKESPASSLLKFTSHSFEKKILLESKNHLMPFKVLARNKKFEFWQRDSLAIPLFTKNIAFQKLDYIHANPVRGHWQLAKDSCLYKYSSASFYEQGASIFSFLKDLRLEF
jgi:REP element-mobilizing transposase RayT